MTTSEQSLEYRDKAVGYDALADSCRRFTIRTLDEADSSLSLMELATAIAEREDDVAAETRDEELVKEIYTSLYHIHVPKLADAGFVRYNKDQQQVSLSEAAPIDLVERFDD